MSAAGRVPSPAPQRRLVLLGASNLARGIAIAAAATRAVWNEPLDLLAALGHGRSYGMQSNVLGRTLPGIAACQLWADLDARERLPTAAIVTDVGNDLLYSVAPETISAWVKNCFERLVRHQASIVITGIPLASIAALRPWEFRLFRTLLFPFSSLTFPEAQARAGELDERLRGLASEFGARVVEPQTAWYGRDRIHIRRRAQRAAWAEIFAPLTAETPAEILPDALHEFLYLRALTPYQRWFFGIAHGRLQPSGRLRNGTIVSLY